VFDLGPDGELLRRAESSDMRPWVARAIREAMRADLHPSAKVVFAVLAADGGAGGTVDLSLSELAERASISRRQAVYARSELREAGMVSWERGGGLSVCRYSIAPPDEWKRATDCTSADIALAAR
jgi:DNA-binding transcriptional ArsR family regulator